MGRERFLSTYAAAVNRAAGTLGAQLLLVATQHADVDITTALAARLHPGLSARMVTNAEYNHLDIKGILRRVDLLFGMRLHSMILASSELAPIIGLAYQPKVHHYFSNLGVPECGLGFDDFSEEGLVRHILNGWERRAALKAHLRERIPALQRRARKPAEMVGALHRGEDLDRAFAAIAEP
jgi:polysaccharide pyruvyl transferase WcaK-like protein